MASGKLDYNRPMLTTDNYGDHLQPNEPRTSGTNARMKNEKTSRKKNLPFRAIHEHFREYHFFPGVNLETIVKSRYCKRARY